MKTWTEVLAKPMCRDLAHPASRVAPRRVAIAAELQEKVTLARLDRLEEQLVEVSREAWRQARWS